MPTISGTAGNDTLAGTDDVDTIIGQAGNDSLSGLGGNDFLIGGAGNDTIDGGPGNDDGVGFGGATTGVVVDLQAGTASDGLGGTDVLINIERTNATLFDDMLLGDANDNVFGTDDGGNDTMDGRGGNDRVVYLHATGPVNVDLLAGTASGPTIGNDVLVSVEYVNSSNFNDVVKLSNAPGQAITNDGDDIIEGGTSDDYIDGGNGNDTVIYRHPASSYAVTNLGNGSWRISGVDGNDNLVGIENLVFSDSTPTIVSFSPANASVGVAQAPTITVAFSSAITLGTGSITLKDADGKVLATYTAASGNLSVSGSVLTIKPGTLAGTSNFTIDLGAGIVVNAGGSPFAGASGYHFTTAGDGVTLTASIASPNLTGGARDDTLIAGAGNGTLDGGAGNDVLQGGIGHTQMLGGTGSDTLISGSGGGDTMAGGDGADLYYVNSAGDVVTELATNTAALLAPNHPGDLGRSVDKVIASITYTLTAFVENLSLAVGAGGLAAYGNELANVITGNEANNTLVGNAGDDTLDGAAGADTMSGGSGADTYYVDNVGDIVTETATDAQADQLDPRSPDLGRAVDKVVSTISYTLGSFVENLTLADKAGHLNGNGNELNNELYGNEGNNILNGKAGNDTIDGGAGVDTAQYAGRLIDYTLAQGASAGSLALTDKTANRDGADNLVGIERLKFLDGALALDMAATQPGGKAALMMAVATSLGKDFVSLPQFAGMFLSFFDTGASLLDGANVLVGAGITAAFAGGADNASLVKMVYRDVYGTAPDAATLASLVAPLNAGTLSQAQWLADMAATSANQQHVGLAGFATTGWQYSPG